MSAKKILVTKSDTAVIDCPKCKVRKSVQVGSFKGKKHLMRVKCTCSHVFKIELNFRKHYRKTAALLATYSSKSLSLNGHYDHLRNAKNPPSLDTTNCTIKNISIGGVGLKILGGHLIEEGDKLMISFRLDNEKRTLIRRQIIAKTVQGNFVGAEFTGITDHDADLGFYLMA